MADTEAHWRRDLDGEPLHEALAAIAAGFDIELPWIPMPYGPSDPSIAIGPPVARSSCPVGDLPLLALLGHVAAAFDLDYGAAPTWPLSVVSTAIRDFPDEGLPGADVHPFVGFTGSGKSLTERHGLLVALPAGSGPAEQTVQLTDRGRTIRDSDAKIVHEVESAWATRHGDQRITDLRSRLKNTGDKLPTSHVRRLAMTYCGGLAGYRESTPRETSERTAGGSQWPG